MSIREYRILHFGPNFLRSLNLFVGTDEVQVVQAKGELLIRSGRVCEIDSVFGDNFCSVLQKFGTSDLLAVRENTTYRITTAKTCAGGTVRVEVRNISAPDGTWVHMFD